MVLEALPLLSKTLMAVDFGIPVPYRWREDSKYLLCKLDGTISWFASIGITWGPSGFGAVGSTAGAK